MGTKVMVRATRSFDGRMDGEWYWVDPDDARVRALIAGGYYEHQETLPITLPIEPLPPDPEFAARVAERIKSGRRRGQVKVEAESGEHHPDGAS